MPKMQLVQSILTVAAIVANPTLAGCANDRPLGSTTSVGQSSEGQGDDATNTGSPTGGSTPNDDATNPIGEMDASTDSATSSTTAPATEGGATRFDVGGSTGLASGSDDSPSCDPTVDPSCKGCKKIDFLFIVDNSSSMAAHQTNLLDSFGPFIDTITAEVQGTDYHIMVLDSDACPRDLYTDPPTPCQVTGCEEVLGAGQVRDCNVPGGARYLTSALDPATLASSFECIANVGTGGSSAEMPMTALVEAMGPLNMPGQCNAGFLRNDAILVITIISDDHSGWGSDDNENGFGGTPQSWFDAVIAAKGKAENVVVLGLYALLSDQSCIEQGPDESDQFIAFTEMFESQGIVGSVCEPDYNDPFFQDAVDLIDTTCEAFVPPER